MLRKGKYYDDLGEIKSPDEYDTCIYYNPLGSFMCQHYRVGANVNVVDMYEEASNERGGNYLMTEDDPLFEKFRAFITLSVQIKPYYDYYELDITPAEYLELYKTWRAEEEELASRGKT